MTHRGMRKLDPPPIYIRGGGHARETLGYMCYLKLKPKGPFCTIAGLYSSSVGS